MDNKSGDDFPYRAIDTKTAIVRLIYISREKDDSISGKLDHFSLDSPDCPRFTTLSYVCGNKTYPNEITANGYRFHVLESLCPMLELICDTPDLSSGWWWIDSICINQCDDRAAKAERSFQVQLMERIYRESERTLSWLGQGSEDGEVAIEFLHVLVKNRWRLKSQRQREVVRELSNGAKWAALAKLLLRPWWRRVWTLQEYIIPPEFTFFGGTKSIGQNDFKVATQSINLCRQIDDALLKLQTFQPAWNRRRLYMWRLEPTSCHSSH
jgi:hypothetical protein